MLLTVGDSFTVKRFPSDIPWPEMLSKEMNLDLINRSHEGTSNQYIFRNFVQEIVTNPNITHCVIALSNWNRLEVGINKGVQYDHVSTNTKTLISHSPDSELDASGRHNPDLEIEKIYKSYFNYKYYLDATLTFIKVMSNLSDRYNINLVITQLVKPFPFGALGKRTAEKEEALSYLQGHQFLKTIDTNYIKCFDFNYENLLCIIINEKDLWYKWTGHYVKKHGDKHCMGYHDQMGDRFKSEFDLHPSYYGHEIITKSLLGCF